MIVCLLLFIPFSPTCHLYCLWLPQGWEEGGGEAPEPILYSSQSHGEPELAEDSSGISGGGQIPFPVPSPGKPRDWAGRRILLVIHFVPSWAWLTMMPHWIGAGAAVEPASAPGTVEEQWRQQQEQWRQQQWQEEWEGTGCAMCQGRSVEFLSPLGLRKSLVATSMMLTERSMHPCPCTRSGTAPAQYYTYSNS